MTDEETRDASVLISEETISALPKRWRLVVAGHRNPRLLGREHELEPRETLELGRGGSAFGERVLDDDRLSRKHARIRVDADNEAVEVEDLGSRNGTYLNGRACESLERMASGDVLKLGDLMLLLYLAPARPRRPHNEHLIGIGPVHEALCDATDKVAPHPTTVLLVGPPGAGKSHLARAIHDASGRDSLTVFHCGAESLDAEALDSAGTLLLEGITEASPALQAQLLPILDDDDGPRIIATSQHGLDEGRLRPDLVARLRRWVIHLPPLLRRREDIPLLADAFVQRYDGRSRPLHPKLTLALLQNPWPGNLRQLEAVIECACIDAPEDAERLRLSSRVRSLLAPSQLVEKLAHERTTVSAPTEGPELSVAEDGTWFQLVDGERVDIARRKTLTRVLAALLAQRLEHPGTAMSIPSLLQAGWPDERVMEKAGANRVHVALTTLRKLGLREMLLRRDEGYLLDPDRGIKAAAE
jgi:transcriptional regulator of acetoin/glycerol metabolism